jgi:hypothetical protein
VFSHDGNSDDHGIRRANTTQAHARWRWRHLVALHEATDTLHWAMCLAPHLPCGMVVAIAINSVTFYCIIAKN